jgi:hypothetical protein
MEGASQCGSGVDLAMNVAERYVERDERSVTNRQET